MQQPVRHRAQPAEFTARNQANIAWMREAFSDAQGRGSAAIMIIAQANPGWDQSDATRAPLRDPKTLAETDGQPDGFQEFLSALRDEVIAFRKPVAYVHGDSHYHRSTSRSRIPWAAGWRTSRAWRPSATTRATGPTT